MKSQISNTKFQINLNDQNTKFETGGSFYSFRNFPKLILQNILRKKIRKELSASPCCPSPPPASLARDHKKRRKISEFEMDGIHSSFGIFLLKFGIYLFFGICFLEFSLAQAIEVGGHLIENTIWTPDNNPHLVTSVLYVDEDITLTILPGTIVKFNDAFLQHQNNDEFWFNGGNEPLAKLIRCEGRIIAEGTEQDSIVFTRVNDEPQHHWGTIYITENGNFQFLNTV